MMFQKLERRYTARFKFHLISEVLRGSNSIHQIARFYGVHPITISHWKRKFMEKGAEHFEHQATIHEFERKTRELKRLIG